MLTIERLKEVLELNPETEDFTWKVHLGCRGRAGNRAGHKLRKGDNTTIGIDGGIYRKDWLVEFYRTGVYPRERETVSGVRGVSWIGRANKWQVRVRIDGVQRYVGLFADKEEAGRFYKECMEKLSRGEEVWSPKKRRALRND
jgi:hypothetical protein